MMLLFNFLLFQNNGNSKYYSFMDSVKKITSIGMIFSDDDDDEYNMKLNMMMTLRPINPIA